MHFTLSSFRLVFLLLALSGATAALAEPSESHKEAALDLLKLIGVDAGVEPMMTRVREAMLVRILALMPQPADEETLAPYLARLSTVLERRLVWDALRADFINAYAAKFTEAELVALIAFFRSPVGAKYLNSVTELNRVAMDIVREKATTATPEIKAITTEMLNALAGHGEPAKS